MIWNAFLSYNRISYIYLGLFIIFLFYSTDLCLQCLYHKTVIIEDLQYFQYIGGLAFLFKVIHICFSSNSSFTINLSVSIKKEVALFWFTKLLNQFRENWYFYDVDVLYFFVPFIRFRYNNVLASKNNLKTHALGQLMYIWITWIFDKISLEIIQIWYFFMLLIIFSISSKEINLLKFLKTVYCSKLY